jgi:hypothetical protein
MSNSLNQKSEKEYQLEQQNDLRIRYSSIFVLQS